MKEKLFTRNFTFLILGQVSSLMGNYTLKFALSMYVLEQTGSASVFAGRWRWQCSPRFCCLPLEVFWQTGRTAATLWWRWMPCPVWLSFLRVWLCRWKGTFW